MSRKDCVVGQRVVPKSTELAQLKLMKDKMELQSNFIAFSFYSSVHLRASVILSQEYPTTPPLFSIAVTCGQSVIRDSLTKVWTNFNFLGKPFWRHFTKSLVAMLVICHDLLNLPVWTKPAVQAAKPISLS